MNQIKTPLFTAMQNYIDDGAMAFHTPGHKQGKGAPEEMRRLITPTGLKMEVSLMEELDDIHGASGCIKKAQDLAAELYGADETRFFINGTTGAIHAMILSALNPGEQVLVPRNAHRSVLGALELSGAVPVFIQPEIDEAYGIAMSVTPQAVLAAVEAHPAAKALVMVYPTYYGVAGDIKKIADIVHAHNMVLLVDEAHGPHLKFSDALPMQALDGGADIAAQSTHKITGSMTQTSMLHLKGNRIDSGRFSRMCSLVQSTSPNYLLLASLDTARRQLAADGEKLIGRAVQLSQKLRRSINEIEGLKSFGTEYMDTPGKYALDVTKITVSVRGLGITGSQAESVLRHKYKIQCELSDFYNLLFIISYADTERECAHLLKALQGLADDFRGKKSSPLLQLHLPGIPEMVLTPRQAAFSTVYNVPFAGSAGKIVGEMITFYPPGIPVIYPGERISQDLIDYVLLQQQSGGNVIGPIDKTLSSIAVIEERTVDSHD